MSEILSWARHVVAAYDFDYVNVHLEKYKGVCKTLPYKGYC